MHIKSSKKLRLVEDPINELKGLVESEGNYTEYTETASIKAGGNHWIRHLVNTLK